MWSAATCRRTESGVVLPHSIIIFVPVEKLNSIEPCEDDKSVGAACSRDSDTHRGYKPLPQKPSVQSLKDIVAHPVPDASWAALKPVLSAKAAIQAGAQNATSHPLPVLFGFEDLCPDGTTIAACNTRAELGYRWPFCLCSPSYSACRSSAGRRWRPLR
jgi:hypothetical protein